MKYQSQFRKLQHINLPTFTGTRVLMMPVLLEDINSLPNELNHYKHTLEELINISPVKEGTAYLTIDEKFVQEGKTLRLQGLHVDGIGADDRQDIGIWAITGLQGYLAGMWDEGKGKWMQGAAGIGGMITVSSPAGCRAWNKEFEGSIRHNGNCEHLRNQFPENESTLFEKNIAYWCNAACVHESVTMTEHTNRIFVRLSMPSKAPWYQGYTKNPKGIKPTGPIIPDQYYRIKESEIILRS